MWLPYHLSYWQYIQLWTVLKSIHLNGGISSEKIPRSGIIQSKEKCIFKFSRYCLPSHKVYSSVHFHPQCMRMPVYHRLTTECAMIPPQPNVTDEEWVSVIYYFVLLCLKTIFTLCASWPFCFPPLSSKPLILCFSILYVLWSYTRDTSVLFVVHVEEIFFFVIFYFFFHGVFCNVKFYFYVVTFVKLYFSCLDFEP